MKSFLSFLPGPERRKALSPILIPSVVIVALILGVATTLLLLTYSINLQIESGTKVLSYNLSDQSRVFVQLQRETLKTIIVLISDDTNHDHDAIELQYGLLTSRINHTSLSALKEVAPEDVYQSAQTLIQMWDTLFPKIDALLKDLNNTSLRAEVVQNLRDFELLTNTTEIDYNRARTITLANFADVSRVIPTALTVITIILLGVIATVLIGLYVYIREVQRSEAARQSNLFKDQFLAVMSHELRTPLNAMIGFLGIIKMGGNLPEKTAYMIDRVRDNAERLLMLINDILDLSKIEAKRFEIHEEWVEVQDLATRWKTQTDVLALQKGLKFTMEIDPKLPERIYTDSDALTKIVINLLSNAFKFTKKGEVGLSLRLLNESWEIRVTDTGIGIAEDKMAVVFESFKQVDSSTRRSYGGTGLGLSIVKSLTHLMNGSIKLKSQLGLGSTFTVTLPIRREVPQENSVLIPDTVFSKQR